MLLTQQFVQQLLPATVNTQKIQIIRDFLQQFLPMTVSSFKLCTQHSQFVLNHGNHPDTLIDLSYDFKFR